MRHAREGEHDDRREAESSTEAHGATLPRSHSADGYQERRGEDNPRGARAAPAHRDRLQPLACVPLLGGCVPKLFEGLPLFLGAVPEFLGRVPNERERVPENLEPFGFLQEGLPFQRETFPLKG